MRFRIDSIATDLAAQMRPAGRPRAVPQDAASRPTAAPAPATVTPPEGGVGDTRIGRALEVRLRGQVLSLSRAAINAQTQAKSGPTQRLSVIAEEIRGLAARAASGTLTDSERGTIERSMRNLERELRTALAGADPARATDGASPISAATDFVASTMARTPLAALVAQANTEPAAVLARL